MITDLRYFLGEALRSMNRSRGVSLLAVATIAIGLSMLGTFLYLSSNLNALVVRWTGEVQLNVYLLEDTTPEDLASLREALDRDPRVERAIYVSKEEALSRFQTYFADLRDLPDRLGTNPLPASLEVLLVEEHRSPEAVQEMADSLAAMGGVENVQYDTGWVERLDSLIRLGSSAGFLLGGILLVAATFTTSNVIRLALFSRQDEIEILQLVGATRGFIQGPFLIEGALQGSVGGLVALAGLAISHMAFRSAADLNLLLRLATTHFLGPLPALALVAGGGAMGLAGSFLAVRKYLRSSL